MIPVAIASGCICWALVVVTAGRWPRSAGLLAIVGLLIAAAVAVLAPLGSELAIGGAHVVDRVVDRWWLAAQAFGLAALLVVPSAEPIQSAGRVRSGSVALVGVAGSSLALGVDLPVVAFAAIAASAFPVITAVGSTGSAGPLAFKVAAASAAVGLLALQLVPGSETAAALATALVAAVLAIWTGILPFHVPRLRLAGASPLTVVPLQAAWLPGVVAVLLVGWATAGQASATLPVDVRFTLVVLSGLTIVLAGAAMLLQAEFGRLIAAAAIGGLAPAMLAFAGGRIPSADLRLTLLVAATGSTALAAWAASVVTASGTRDLGDTRGWLRRVPVAGVALLVLVAGAVGWPGTPGWDARRQIVDGAVSGPLGTVIFAATILAALAPLRALWLGPRRATGPTPARWPVRLFGSLMALGLAAVPGAFSLGLLRPPAT